MAKRGETGPGPSDLTARLASSASLEEFVAEISRGFQALGFGAVWIARTDPFGDGLATIHELGIERRESGERWGRAIWITRAAPRRGVGCCQIVNVREPSADLELGDRFAGAQELAIPSDVVERFGGAPFAYGALVGSRGEPVGGLGLGRFRGHEPIPDEMFERDTVPCLINHLGLALERDSYLRRLDRMEADAQRLRAAAARETFTRTVGELVGPVAHDMNNLVGIALMALNALQPLGQAAAPFVARAERATKAMGDLSRRLQRMARTGSQAALSGPADLRQIVEDVAVLIRPLCREHSIRLDLDLVELGDTALVQGDQTAIRHAVTSLVVNAREAVMAVAEERRLIEIRVERRTEEIALVIRDGGGGIPPEVRGRLFEPFVTTKPGHVGLGLATVRGAMKEVGGRVDITPDPEGGACFRLTFKLSPLAEPRASVAAVGRPDRSLRVLVVDDERDFVIGVRDLLRTRNHEVASAPDTRKAFAIAAVESFDLVLIDLGLPGKDGLDLLQALRGQGVKSKMVLMTGWDSEVARADERASHCDGILQKPFQLDEIERLVGELFPPARA